MKTRILMFLAAVIMLSGCTAMYGKEEQYNKGDWYFFADSNEVARIKQDKLAFEKLKSQPTQTAMINGVPQGYKGVVVNLSDHNRYNFQCKGPETKSYYLGPGQREVDYLLPGTYSCEVSRGGDRVGETTFSVGLQTKKFLGEAYHWYVYAEW